MGIWEDGMKKLILILFLLGALMHVTNPNKEDFEKFYSDKIERIIDREQEKSSGFFSKLGASFKNRLKKSSALNSVEVKDYFIFSTYTVTILGTEEHYIGGFRKFFIISGSIEKKIEESSEDLMKEIERLEDELIGN
jgi:thioredoxin-related protein